MTNLRRTATVVCKTNSHLISISKESFNRVINVYEEELINDNI